MTIIELTALRETLQRALFSGTKSIQHGDQSRTFQSLDDMRKALAELDAEIVRQSGTDVQHTTYGSMSSG